MYNVSGSSTQSEPDDYDAVIAEYRRINWCIFDGDSREVSARNPALRPNFPLTKKIALHKLLKNNIIKGRENQQRISA